jgi:hypothetical protein
MELLHHLVTPTHHHHQQQQKGQMAGCPANSCCSYLRVKPSVHLPPGKTLKQLGTGPQQQQQQQQQGPHPQQQQQLGVFM